MRDRLSEPSRLHRFGDLYRSACADLALADAYQLPPSHVEYLHQLVGRAHNQLYRSRKLQTRRWATVLLAGRSPNDPRRSMRVRAAAGCFWGTFLLAAAVAADPREWPDFVEQLLAPTTIAYLEETFEKPVLGHGPRRRISGWRPSTSVTTSGIGLQCFAGGLLFVPGLLITIYNAALLGATFGFMARPDIAGGDHFFQFVTAHAPCELTAIVLSSGAGLKLGMGWVRTTRHDEVRVAPPSGVREHADLGGRPGALRNCRADRGLSVSVAGSVPAKAVAAAITGGLIAAYFFVLGWPRHNMTPRPDLSQQPGTRSAATRIGNAT